MTRRSLLALAGVLALTLPALAGATPALAQAPASSAPWWGVYAEVLPTYLPPEGKGEIIVVAGNLGDTPVEGAKHTVTITDTLPAGLEAIAPAALDQQGVATASHCPSGTPGNPVVCTFTGTLDPYDQLELHIKVAVKESSGTVTTLQNQVRIEGGDAPETSRTEQLRVSGEAMPFGMQVYEFGLFGENATGGGGSDLQAGSHPAELTTTLVLNQENAGAERRPVALPKDLRFDLPPGLVGDANAVAQCPLVDFDAHVYASDYCPRDSMVGAVTATVRDVDGLGVITKTAPVFNLVPAHGEPARLGFEVMGLVFVTLDTSLQAGGDYGVVASVEDTDQSAGLLSSQVTLWGVPGAAAHNPSRGWTCVGGGVAEGSKEVEGVSECPDSTPPGESETPFLISPTSCVPDPASEPLEFPLEMDSWTPPSSFISPPPYAWSGQFGEALGFTGCEHEQVPFDPSLEIVAETHAGSTPTGLAVNVKLPQKTTLEANGVSEADVRDTTVTLPAGMQLNPSAANGLQACPESKQGADGLYEGVGFTGFQKFYGPGLEPQPETATFTPTFRLTEEEVEGKAIPPSCPQASKVGTVRIRTPLLPKEVEGALYLAEPAPNGEAEKNPFDSLVALYLVAEDREAGILVKQAGKGEVNPVTGQITTTFRDTPQVPFEELKAELFGGQRASLSTPDSCGADEAEASFTPWSAALEAAPTPARSPGEQLDISEGCSSGTPPFSPSLQAQSTNGQAGAFTPFELTLARPDGDQALRSFTVEMPPGLAAVLAAVPPCPEPQASQGACSEESEIGESLASSGVGSEPYGLPGKVYLTGPYDGAPFGLSTVTPLEHVGPFDLGRIVVRSGISVNEHTAQASIDTGASTLISSTGQSETFEGLPERIKGVPAQLKTLTVTVQRPQGKPFTFNPTNCSPMAVTATLNGWQGASESTSYPFQVSNCASLPFDPTLTASVGGHASKTDGTSLHVTVTSAGVGQANIQKVDLQLPKALSSRLSTLQKACAETAFDANPASCDPDSVVGHATIHTPIFKNPLSGPAYLVSHGGAAFPDLEFVLQGENITIVLDGKTDIKEGITYSKFESAPDAPFTVFETELPSGPDSILTANVPEKEDFSLCKASLQMPTKITGQNGAVIEHATIITATGCEEKKLSRSQQLAKALKTCRTQYKHSRKKRAACEKQARRRYAAKTAKRGKAKKTTHHH